MRAGRESALILMRYSHGDLLIDGTPGGRGNDTVRLPFDRDWRAGKTYQLDFKGKHPVDILELKVTGHGP